MRFSLWLFLPMLLVSCTDFKKDQRVESCLYTSVNLLLLTDTLQSQYRPLIMKGEIYQLKSLVESEDVVEIKIGERSNFARGGSYQVIKENTRFPDGIKGRVRQTFQWDHLSMTHSLQNRDYPRKFKVTVMDATDKDGKDNLLVQVDLADLKGNALPFRAVYKIE